MGGKEGGGGEGGTLKVNSKQNAQRELIEQKTVPIETLHPSRLAVSICGGLFGFPAGQLIRNHQQDKQTDRRADSR